MHPPGVPIAGKPPDGTEQQHAAQEQNQRIAGRGEDRQGHPVRRLPHSGTSLDDHEGADERREKHHLRGHKD
ncbi:MAG TPA: hypothetical protein VNP04_18350 [Alphaproteobacteria bacterium]|nr:hypothetical protein [Alphaproteobacteria bacterium]